MYLLGPCIEIRLTEISCYHFKPINVRYKSRAICSGVIVIM